MITNINFLKKYCKNYTKIENYEEAVKSPLKYDLHHRREISENKSRKDLIAENLYYNRPATELIFLERGEHQRLHNAGKQLSTETRQKMSNAKKNMSEETKQKMSESNKGNQNALGHHWNPSAETRQILSEAMKGDKNPMFGKNMSAETRKKISESKKGKNLSAETRKKMSEAHKGKLKGRHWHLENGRRIYTD